MTEYYTDYSALIYKHSSIEACDTNNYKSIIALQDIKCGELLLLEHVFSAPATICHLVIENNAKLFDSYHPRTTKFIDTIDKSELAKEKLTHNCFGMAGNKIINIYLQQINHSCTASCAVYIHEHCTLADTNIVFMELYTVKYIAKGTELTINYGPETSHKRDFKCNCGKKLVEREKIFLISANLAKSLSGKNNTVVKEKIFEYLELPLSKKILLNQYLSVNGIYMNDNTISGYSIEGRDMINSVIHKCMGIGENQIESIDGKIIEAPMNAHKLNLFLRILNENILLKHST